MRKMFGKKEMVPGRIVHQKLDVNDDVPDDPVLSENKSLDNSITDAHGRLNHEQTDENIS